MDGDTCGRHRIVVLLSRAFSADPWFIAVLGLRRYRGYQLAPRLCPSFENSGSFVWQAGIPIHNPPPSHQSPLTICSSGVPGATGVPIYNPPPSHQSPLTSHHLQFPAFPVLPAFQFIIRLLSPITSHFSPSAVLDIPGIPGATGVWTKPRGSNGLG